MRYRAPVPQITGILYRPKCGLIMSCFTGYVEVFDTIMFKSKHTWDNQLEQKIGSEVGDAQKARIRKIKQGWISQDFSGELEDVNNMTAASVGDLRQSQVYLSKHPIYSS